MARRIDRDGGPDEEPAVEAHAPAPAADGSPILLVDDRPENLRALAAVLEPLGLPLVCAGSGRSALRMVLERDFAVILLDVRMPGLDGLETAQLIKHRQRSRDIPIIFLTAAHDDVGAIVRGYEVGAVDYVLKPFDGNLLRSKVSTFVELQESRRALERSEALLRGAFDASPSGITVLDAAHRIVRANTAFARALGRTATALQGLDVVSLADPADASSIVAALQAARGPDASAPGPVGPELAGLEVRVLTDMGVGVPMALIATAIESSEPARTLVLAQWLDLSARQRARQARAELLVEQSARADAESRVDRLRKLQTLTDAPGSLALRPMVERLVVQIETLFEADAAELVVSDRDEDDDVVARAVGGRIVPGLDAMPLHETARIERVPLRIERDRVGSLALFLGNGRPFSAADRSLLHEAAERAALSIRQAQLYEEEHRIASELQRGLLPKRLPEVERVRMAAHYQAAGGAAQVGGDWYDAFELPGGRLGVVVGDVAGRGIPAASTMGQLRSITRAFAVADRGESGPGAVLTRLNRYQLALGEEQFFTVVYAVVDPAAGRLTWANAGHMPPLLRGGEIEYLEGGGIPMGIDAIDYPDAERPLTAGGGLVLYTDGLIERRDESIDDGLHRLAAAVRTGPDAASAPESLVGHVLAQSVPDGFELHDDVTVVVVGWR